jgi:DNA-binding LacI/PurR family transcriptional regulator
VRLPLERIGHLAARTLLAELESGPQDAGAIQTLLGVELMVRGTTATAPK